MLWTVSIKPLRMDRWIHFMETIKTSFYVYKTCVYNEDLWAIQAGRNTLQQKNLVPKADNSF